MMTRRASPAGIERRITDAAPVPARITVMETSANSGVLPVNGTTPALVRTLLHAAAVIMNETDLRSTTARNGAIMARKGAMVRKAGHRANMEPVAGGSGAGRTRHAAVR